MPMPMPVSAKGPLFYAGLHGNGINPMAKESDVHAEETPIEKDYEEGLVMEKVDDGLAENEGGTE
jgi:hypothetical protein